MRFLRRVSGYTLTDHVCNMTMCTALQIHALEESIPDYKNMWHNHILRMDSSRLTQKVQNFQADKEMLDDQEDNGRSV
jgi:hypothetical protein